MKKGWSIIIMAGLIFSLVVIPAKAANSSDKNSIDDTIGQTIDLAGNATMTIYRMVSQGESTAYYYFAANGEDVVIDKKNDNETILRFANSTYTFNHNLITNGTTKKNRLHVFGGYNSRTDATNNNVENTNIIMNGGYVDAIIGGSNDKGITKNVNIAINGGNVNNLYGGSWGPSMMGNAQGSLATSDECLVESSKVIINNGLVNTLFGGGSGYQKTKLTHVEINGGEIAYNAVVAGSNGKTDTAILDINANVNIGMREHPSYGTAYNGLLAHNAGANGTATINMKNGHVILLSLGNDDGNNLDVTFNHTTLNVSGGIIDKLNDSCTEPIDYESLYSMNVERGTITNIHNNLKPYVNEIVTATSVTLNKTIAELDMGENMMLQATLNPVDTTDKLSWESSNTAVASVDTTGKVTANAPGKVTITAKLGTKSAACEVSVNPLKINTPTIDTTKPVDQITVGVNDKASQDIISNVASSIVADIVEGKDVNKVDSQTVAAIKEAVRKGLEITIEVKVEKIDADQIDEKDKGTIIKFVREEKIGNETVTIVEYLDLSILLKTNEGTLGTVNALDKEVAFTIAIPKELLKEGRTFYVVRVHNGVAETLPVTINEDGTITFTTDKFSTFALAYVDAGKVSGVDTKDTTNVTSFIALMGLAILVAGGTLHSRKKRIN